MRPVEAKTLPQTTLFETFAPIERYFQELRARTGAAPAPPASLGAEDAYLLRLLAVWRSGLRAVVDLAGAATWGATTLLWSGAEGTPVVAPALPADAQCADWVSLVQEARTCEAGDVPAPGGGTVQGVLAGLAQSCDARPPLVVLPLVAGEGGDPLEGLAAVHAAQPRAIIVALPLGRIGEDDRLARLLTWASGAGRRVTAARELAPFLASAQLAVVAPDDDRDTRETLKRVQRLFTSNFDFLTLAEQTYTLSRAHAKLEGQLKTANARNAELEQVLREREALLDEAQQRVAEVDRSARGWARECERAAKYALELEDNLRSLTASRSWSLAQRLASWRHKLAPRNSLRARCARFVFRVQRRLLNAA